MTDDEKAVQTQAAAEAIGEALAPFSKGAVFFGTALYLAQYLHANLEDEDHDEQIGHFVGVVKSLLAHAKSLN